MRYHVWYWICHIGTSNIAFVASIACNFTFFASIAWTCACDKNTKRHDCPTVWKQSWIYPAGLKSRPTLFFTTWTDFFVSTFFFTQKRWEAGLIYDRQTWCFFSCHWRHHCHCLDLIVASASSLSPLPHLHPIVVHHHRHWMPPPPLWLSSNADAVPLPTANSRGLQEGPHSMFKNFWCAALFFDMLWSCLYHSVATETDLNMKWRWNIEPPCAVWCVVRLLDVH